MASGHPLCLSSNGLKSFHKKRNEGKKFFVNKDNISLDTPTFSSNYAMATKKLQKPNIITKGKSFLTNLSGEEKNSPAPFFASAAGGFNFPRPKSNVIRIDLNAHNSVSNKKFARPSSPSTQSQIQ